MIAARILLIGSIRHLPGCYDRSRTTRTPHVNNTSHCSTLLSSPILCALQAHSQLQLCLAIPLAFEPLSGPSAPRLVEDCRAAATSSRVRISDPIRISATRCLQGASKCPLYFPVCPLPREIWILLFR